MTTTRFYFPFGGSVPVSVPFDTAVWSRTAAAVRFPLVTTTTGAGQVPLSDTETDTGITLGLIAQYVGPDNLIAGELSGNLEGLVIACSEDNLANNTYLRVVVRVVSQDGTVKRGYLLDTTDTSEMALSLITRVIPATPLDTIVVQNNDRLIVELGYSSNNDNTSRSTTLTLGNHSALSDFSLTDGLSDSSGRPWIQLNTHSGTTLKTVSGNPVRSLQSGSWKNIYLAG